MLRAFSRFDLQNPVLDLPPHKHNPAPKFEVWDRVFAIPLRPRLAHLFDRFLSPPQYRRQFSDAPHAVPTDCIDPAVLPFVPFSH
jgi:hypothetical protein